MFLAARAALLSMRASEDFGQDQFQARSKDQEILEEGGGAGPSS